MFLAQIGCAVIGVLAFSIFGPGWLARSTGLAAAIAFMIYTRAIHPPGNHATIGLLKRLLESSESDNNTLSYFRILKWNSHVSICSCELALAIRRWSKVARLEFLVCFLPWCCWMRCPLVNCEFLSYDPHILHLTGMTFRLREWMQPYFRIRVLFGSWICRWICRWKGKGKRENGKQNVVEANFPFLGRFRKLREKCLYVCQKIHFPDPFRNPLYSQLWREWPVLKFRTPLNWS